MRTCSLIAVMFAASCSEYDFANGPEVGAIDADPAGDALPDTGARDTATHGLDTAIVDTATADGCYEPEDGYDENPAARLIVTDASGLIIVTYTGADSSYYDDLSVISPFAQFVATGMQTAPGAQFEFGPFPVGTEIVFGIHVQNTGDAFESGPAERNPDGVVHVATTYEGGCAWRIGFEDLFGGGDRDYNDAQLTVRGLLRQDL